MKKRPFILTLIGWFLIVMSVFGIFRSFFMGGDEFVMGSDGFIHSMLDESPLPLEVHQAIEIVRSVITLVCGFGILKGWNWARYVYVGTGVLGLALNLVTFAIKSILLLDLVLVGMIAFFLFRHAASAWFTRDGRLRASEQ